VRALALLFVVAACGAPKPAPAAPAADPKAEVEAAYAAYAHACETNDLGGVMARLTDDVEWRLADGTVQHRAEIEPSMKGFLASIPPGSKVWFTYDDITPNADGSVLAKVVFHLQKAGDATDHGDPWHDTWVKAAGGWQNSVGIEQPKPAS
jgi:hypothetical protein